jgi:hypothetical protein
MSGNRRERVGRGWESEKVWASVPGRRARCWLVLDGLVQLCCQLEEQITACQSDPDVARLAEVRAELEGFDLDAYLAAEGRLANAELRADKEAELSRLQQADEMAAAVEASDLCFGEIRAAYREAESAREHIAKAGELGRKLEALASGLEDARAEVLRREGIRDRLNAELGTARTQRRFGHQHQKTLIKENAQQLAAAISRRGSAASAPGICETCSPSTASSPGLHNGQFAYLPGFTRSDGCFVSINRATVVVQR